MSAFPPDKKVFGQHDELGQHRPLQQPARRPRITPPYAHPLSSGRFAAKPI